MGGDHAPVPEVAGAVAAARNWSIPILLVGDKERIETELAKHQAQGLPISIRHCTEVITMHDSASDAIRKKKDSSIRVAFEAARDGSAAAVVSAGNSGATMAAAMFILKRIPGIERPAIATIMPSKTGFTLVLDVGANVDCKPKHLAQFALMGDVYARKVLRVENPRVGLLSNGEEEGKGNDLTREAHELLREAPFNYRGYVEGRDIFNGSCDVAVCDGFVGNVLLKSSEGLADAVFSLLKEEIGSRFLAKIGYLLARSAFAAFRKKVDYAEYGGAPLLGVNGVGMICHGGSNEKAIMNAIRSAEIFVRRNAVSEVQQQLCRFEESVAS